MFLRFFQRLAHCGPVCGDQSLITANNGHDRDGLRCRKRHVIEGPGLALFRAIAGNAICPVPLSEEFSRLRVKTLPYRLEILGCNLSFKPKQFSSPSVPPAFDRPILVVVVALLEMALCVAFTAGHGTNRQHMPSLALFEVRYREWQLVVGMPHRCHSRGEGAEQWRGGQHRASCECQQTFFEEALCGSGWSC
jgi:hypothetical protein